MIAPAESTFAEMKEFDRFVDMLSKIRSDAEAAHNVGGAGRGIKFSCIASGFSWSHPHDVRHGHSLIACCLPEQDYRVMNHHHW